MAYWIGTWRFFLIILTLFYVYIHWLYPVKMVCELDGKTYARHHEEISSASKKSARNTQKRWGKKKTRAIVKSTESRMSFLLLPWQAKESNRETDIKIFYKYLKNPKTLAIETNDESFKLWLHKIKVVQKIPIVEVDVFSVHNFTRLRNLVHRLIRRNEP